MNWFSSFLQGFAAIFNAPSLKTQTGGGYDLSKYFPTVSTLPKQSMPGQLEYGRQQSIDNQRLLSPSAQRALNQRAIPYLELFSKYSHIYRIPYGVLQSLAERESSMGTIIGSPSRAYGIMQLLPPHANGTWAQVWTSQGNPPPKRVFDRANAEDSIRHAAWYLSRILYPRFNNWPQAIAAFNLGETKTAAIVRANGSRWRDALPQETKDYINYSYARTGIG